MATMEAGQARRENTLEELLAAGREAFSTGDRSAAHELWRMAAVANPYDERVWSSLMQVLTRDDDREVCLENIIAINPLNPDARRQLRAIKRTHQKEDADELDSSSRRQLRAQKRAERMKAEAAEADEPFIPPERQQAVRSLASRERQTQEIDSSVSLELLDLVERSQRRRSVSRSVLRGVEVGLVAVLLGLVISVIAYSGMLPFSLR